MPTNDTSWPPFAFGRDSAWGCAYVAFLRRVQMGSEHTHARYEYVLTRFFTEPPARMPDRYARADVESFLSAPGMAKGHVGQPPGPATMNSRLSALNSFYAYCGGYAVIGEDGTTRPLMNRMSPTSGLRRMQAPLSYKALSDEELHRFFAAIGTGDLRAIRDKSIFLLLFWCARRRSEIASLRLKDIEQGVSIDGSEKRLGTIYHFRNKGKKAIDDMQEMPPAAAVALFDYLTQSGKLEHGQPDDPVFTALPSYIGRGGYDPKRQLTPQSIWYICKKYARKAGLDVSPHSFRHSAARVRYAAGSDIREIQQLLRHSSLATTDLYLRQLMPTADPGYALLEKDFSGM